eukprot:CAMPEP_0176430568 /NCGR_PEP_ID=MMETSP0127-20121128/14326_1 /TAXON_ID=938130 /ORGANISM="Platyophrya macrostoma, Strain WH" /LENGTH=230 /DNA_ID=CAMNT_0017812473 /DNA_START=23 /DNA_END=712 /DNA_ORIENTATION=-
MRVISLSILVILVLGTSALRTSSQSRKTEDFGAAVDQCLSPLTDQVVEGRIPDVIKSHAEAEIGEIFTTTAQVGGEEIHAYLPTEGDFIDEAPISHVHLEGEDAVVQVLEAYESESGEHYVVVNAGGEAVTVPGDVYDTEIPLAQVDNHGDVTVAEVVGAEECSGKDYVVAVSGPGEYEVIEGDVITEPITEVPRNLIETPEYYPPVLIGEGESTPDVTTNTVTVGGEEL